MKEICSKEKCTGCCACMNKCPQNCIKMKEDEYGSLVPEIDESKCINCNLCLRTCPINNVINSNNPIKAYAAWSLNENERKTSASGGIATTFYKHIVSKGGYIAGTSFNEKMELKHSLVNNEEQIEKFKGSKYIQSYIGYIYRNIKEKLEQGEKVLFIGTPCQVAGVNMYLNREYKNLITIDLICHGVPSNKLLNEHVKNIENKQGKCINRITFRGEDRYLFTAYQDEKIVYQKSSREDLFLLGFLNGIFSRKSCYQCKYANLNRISDITIGDFLGLGKEKKFKYSTKNGVSLILTNTKKGEKFLEECKNELFLEERDIDEATKENEQLKNPTKETEKHTMFLRLYPKHGFEYSCKKCLKKELKDIKKEKIINRIASLINRRQKND